MATNTRKWSGDHFASDPSNTSGIFFSNRAVETQKPSILDIAPTVLKILAAAPPGRMAGRALAFSPASEKEFKADFKPK